MGAVDGAMDAWISRGCASPCELNGVMVVVVLAVLVVPKLLM
jgi:hypothetical protein